MNYTVETGHDLTGMRYPPKDAVLLAEAARHSVSSGGESSTTLVRAEYLARRTKIGTKPPPAPFNGAALTGKSKAAASTVEGGKAAVLLDKVGDRLAFERTGAWLYSTVIDKFDASGPFAVGPTRDDLVQIQSEELEHFELCRRSLIDLGGEPTALTPSADVGAVISMGLLQVMGDPRMSFKKSLEAVLIAELVDNDGWTLLVALARTLGHDGLAARFGGALAVEQQHLAEVRAWVTEMASSDAHGSAD